MVVWLQLSYRQVLPLKYWLVQYKAWPSTQIMNQKLNYIMYRYFLAHAEKRVVGWNGWCNGMGNVRQCKGHMDLSSCILLLGQHCQISWNGHCVGSTRSQGQMRWDWWCDCDRIWSGTVRGQLVEIDASHQIWWNILREQHNWGVPSVHINFIYYVTYIVEYLIMLQGCMHTGTYTILYLHAWELLLPWLVWEHLELHLGSTGQK